MKFPIAWIVTFVAWMAGSFVVHGTLLAPDYAGLPNLFRPPADAQAYFPFLLLAHVILSGVFVWIYRRGQEAKPWLAQGTRYGAAIALFVAANYLIYYAVQPMPGALVARQIALDGVLIVVLGTLIAFLHRSRPPA